MSRAALEFSKTLAHRAERKIFCAKPEFKNLTAEELSDLHLFKHELLAAVYRLYQRVTPSRADPVLMKYFSMPVDKIEGAGVAKEDASE